MYDPVPAMTWHDVSKLLVSLVPVFVVGWAAFAGPAILFRVLRSVFDLDSSFSCERVDDRPFLPRSVRGAVVGLYRTDGPWHIVRSDGNLSCGASIVRRRQLYGSKALSYSEALEAMVDYGEYQESSFCPVCMAVFADEGVRQ